MVAHKCNECSKRFVRRSELINHLRVHTGEKPYVCNVCKKAFSQPGNLLVHKRIHKDVKLFKCGICNIGFSRKCNMLSHESLHGGSKPFECNQCQAAFSRKQHLVRHMRAHTGEKPYKCSKCEKDFATYSGLANHKIIHTRKRPFKCGVCGSSYTQLSGLRKHCLRWHSDNLLTCSSCNKTFRCITDFVKHKASHKGGKLVECKVSIEKCHQNNIGNKRFHHPSVQVNVVKETLSDIINITRKLNCSFSWNGFINHKSSSIVLALNNLFGKNKINERKVLQDSIEDHDTCIRNISTSTEPSCNTSHSIVNGVVEVPMVSDHMLENQTICQMLGANELSKTSSVTEREDDQMNEVDEDHVVVTELDPSNCSAKELAEIEDDQMNDIVLEDAIDVRTCVSTCSSTSPSEAVVAQQIPNVITEIDPSNCPAKEVAAIEDDNGFDIDKEHSCNVPCPPVHMTRLSEIPDVVGDDTATVQTPVGVEANLVLGMNTVVKEILSKCEEEDGISGNIVVHEQNTKDTHECGNNDEVQSSVGSCDVEKTYNRTKDCVDFDEISGQTTDDVIKNHSLSPITNISNEQEDESEKATESIESGVHHDQSYDHEPLCIANEMSYDRYCCCGDSETESIEYEKAFDSDEVSVASLEFDFYGYKRDVRTDLSISSNLFQSNTNASFYDAEMTDDEGRFLPDYRLSPTYEPIQLSGSFINLENRSDLSGKHSVSYVKEDEFCQCVSDDENYCTRLNHIEPCEVNMKESSHCDTLPFVKKERCDVEFSYNNNVSSLGLLCFCEGNYIQRIKEETI